MRRTYREDHLLQSTLRETLALIGYVDPVKGRGIRVLSIDGGGTRYHIFKKLILFCVLWLLINPVGGSKIQILNYMYCMYAIDMLVASSSHSCLLYAT